jgi:alpha-L-fucosidase
VQLGEGTYAGPVVVPPGVTVRGLGAHRTVIVSAHGAAVTLSDSARLEHVSVSASGAPVAVAGVDATVLGCDIAGLIEVAGRHARLRACRAAGVVADGADQVTVTRCQLSGPPDATGVHLVGGSGHLIDSNELAGHRCSVHLDGTVGATVRGNVVEATWWGVRLRSTDATTVVGNAVAGTARAIDVDGGTSARVEGNSVHDGDSGCVVQAGASDVVVSGNRWERCRTGLLVWDAGVVRHHDNAAIDLHDPDHTVTIGPA